MVYNLAVDSFDLYCDCIMNASMRSVAVEQIKRKSKSTFHVDKATLRHSCVSERTVLEKSHQLWADRADLMDLLYVDQTYHEG